MCMEGCHNKIYDIKIMRTSKGAYKKLPILVPKRCIKGCHNRICGITIIKTY